MDENFDELGNYVGSPEYSDSAESNPESWEDANDSAEDNALVKSLYGPNVEVAHYKHDTQDAREPLIAAEAHSSTNEVIPENWLFHKGIMDTTRSLIRSIAIVGHVNHGKSSFVELFAGAGSTDGGRLEKQRQLTMRLSCHTSLVRDSAGKSYVLNIADTPGHLDFDDEIQASHALTDNDVLVVDAVEGPVLSRFASASVVVVNKLDRLILDLRLTPSKAFDRLRALVEDDLAIDPERVVFMSTRFRFAFTLKSFAALYSSYQNAEGDLQLWNATNFTSFVLDPLYKLFSYGLVGAQSQEMLASLGITLSESEWHLGYNDRIRLILNRFFEDPEFSVVVDLLIKYTVPPEEYKSSKEQMTVAKHVRIGSELLALVRVNFGIVNSHVSQTLYVPFGSNVVTTEAIHAGNWAIIDTDQPPSTTNSKSLVKIGVEPLRDSIAVAEQMTSALEVLSKLYPGLRVQVMETGEYSIWGAGELYLDCVVHDLKTIINCEVHVGPPSTRLLETVSEQSYAACPTRTARHESFMTVLASPLATAIVAELDKGTDTRKFLLQSEWERAEVDAVWDVYHGNILSYESAPAKVDQRVRDAIVQGFEWACSEGPLMEEPLRGVYFKLIDCNFDGTAELIPTMRRACHAAMLLARPRVMEPWLRATILGRLSAGKPAYSELGKRRGHVEADKAVAGTNLYVTQGTLPLMDAFGFEIDVICNMSRRNEAQVSLAFLEWRIVDGDPLDRTLAVPRLKPAAANVLARDFVLKTRRRKGLISDVDLERYLDEDVALTILSK